MMAVLVVLVAAHFHVFRATSSKVNRSGHLATAGSQIDQIIGRRHDFFVHLTK